MIGECEIKDEYVIVRGKDLVLKLRSLGAGIEEGEETKITQLEAAYFAGRNVLPLEKEKILEALVKRDKQVKEKYLVIKYFRDCGQIIRPSLDNTEFLRLHRKGYRPDEDKTYYLIKVVDKKWKAQPAELIKWLDFAGRLRKELCVAIVDLEEDKPLFIKFGRMSFE